MTEKQLSSKQFIILVFIIGIAMKMFMLPAIILKVSGRDSWIVMLFFLCFEFGLLIMFLLINKLCPNMTFYQLLEYAVGKIISRIIVAVLIGYLMIKLTLILSEVKVFFTMSVFENIFWPVYVIPILVFLICISVKTLRGIGRLSEIFLPAIIISMLILAALFVGNVEFEKLMPVLANGFGSVGMSIKQYPFWFGDFATMVIFLGNITKSKRMMSFSIISYIVASIVVMAFSTVLFATYATIPMLLDYGHNISNMTQYSVSSLSYGRFDIVIFSVWVIAVFIKMSIVFFALTRHSVYVSNYKNNYLFAVIIGLAAYILNVFVFPNENILFTFVTNSIKYLVGFFQVVMPVMLLIVAVIRYKRFKRRGRTEIKGVKSVFDAPLFGGSRPNTIKKQMRGKT